MKGRDTATSGGKDDRAKNQADTLAAKVAEVGSTLCGYAPGHGNPALWPSSRCDCKYGASGVGEQNGCAEMRSVYRMLTDATTPRSWWTLL